MNFSQTEFKGSRLRCLQVTSFQGDSLSKFLTSLVQPYAQVHATSSYMPMGMLAPKEPELAKADTFLRPEQRQELVNWWLASPKPFTRTPNWDIVSECTTKDGPGLVLIEAKAHPAELNEEDKCGATSENQKRIKAALHEASQDLNRQIPGWALDMSPHYQLSNRFAWAWKLASMGVPVVLVYLGFLNATEMISDSREIFETPGEWEAAVRDYSQKTVPAKMWNSTITVNGTSLTALIRAADVTVKAQVIKPSIVRAKK